MEPTIEQMAKLYNAIGKAQAEMEGAHKTRTGQVGQQKYKYADLAAVEAAIGDIPQTLGLSLIQIPGQYRDGSQELLTIIAHEDGGVIQQLASIPCQATSQGAGSAITYLRRYALLSIFRILTEDDDGQGAMPPRREQSQPRTNESPRASSEPTRASGGHMAQAAMEMGATPVHRITAAAIDGLRLTTNYPSNGILGAYLNNTGSPTTYHPEQVAEWADANPGADGMALLTAAAEYAVDALPDGPLKVKTKQWLGDNK